MSASNAEIDALATSVVLMTTYWMSFQRLTRPIAARDADPAGMRFAHAAAHVLALLGPYLQGADRTLVEHLGADYLDAADAHGG